MMLPRADRAVAGPQHWGFGMSYLATLRKLADRTALVVYEGPLRAKNATWIPRWIDRTTDFSNVVPGGMAIGNFWPADQGKEYLVVISQEGPKVTLRVLEPPEVFRVGPWAEKSSQFDRVAFRPLGGRVRCRRPGGPRQGPVDPRGTGRDGAEHGHPRAAGVAGVRGLVGIECVALPALTGEFRGLAVGDFWGEGGKMHRVALATAFERKTRIAYCSYDNAGSGSFTPIVVDAAGDLPMIAQGGIVAGDYVKDNFDDVTLIPADPAAPFQLRVAPAKPGQTYNPGPWYTGKAVSGQTLPGNGGASSVQTMAGQFAGGGATPVSVAAGRIFGYCLTVPGTRNKRKETPISTAPDAEISFMHRTPIKDQVPPLELRMALLRPEGQLGDQHQEQRGQRDSGQPPQAQGVDQHAVPQCRHQSVHDGHTRRHLHGARGDPPV